MIQFVRLEKSRSDRLSLEDFIGSWYMWYVCLLNISHNCGVTLMELNKKRRWLQMVLGTSELKMEEYLNIIRETRYLDQLDRVAAHQDESRTLL